MQGTPTLVNYYDILEVPHEVSPEGIKRSFRALIKKYHPDIHGPNKLWAESKTKVIIQAYKTLSDSITREQYDRQYQQYFHVRRTYKQHKKEEENQEAENVKTQARAIFDDLLNGSTHKAIENYELLLKNNKGVEFLSYLKHRDYIDCKFLLAEAYEKRGRHEVAIGFYESILEKDKGDTHRRHLLDEIKERIRNIYCRKLARSASPENALRYYEKVLRLKLYKNENAFIYKKMAECYLKLNEYVNALHHLNIALSLKPNLQGSNKIKIKLKQYIPNIAI